MKPLMLAATVAVLALGLLGVAAVHAQAPKQETPILPSEKLDKAAREAREDLVKKVKNLRIRSEMAAKIDEELQKSGGDGNTALKRGLLGLILEQDVIAAYAPLEAETERLRWYLIRSRNDKTSLVARRQLDVARTQRAIDRLAEDMVRLEDQMNGDKTGDTAATHLKLAGLQAELQELIKQREERATDARALASQIAATDQELNDLKKFQVHMDSLNRLAMIRVERRLDAIEYQSLAANSEKIARSRQSIDEAVKLLEGPRQEIPIQRSPYGADAQKAPLTSPLGKDPSQLAPRSPLLVEELKKAREKLKREEMIPAPRN